MGNDSTGALVTAINNQTTSTGVTASVDTDGMLVLTAADGRNITVTTKTGAIAASLGLSGTSTGTTYIYRSSVQLNDDDSFEITSSSSVEDLTGTAGSLFRQRDRGHLQRGDSRNRYTGKCSGGTPDRRRGHG
jgi:flagellin